MSIFDKMFGHEEKPKQDAQPPQGGYAPPPVNPQGYQQTGPPPPLTDEQAIARYKYMLKTAPPETIEQAHQEAFSQLSPQQRQMVLQQLTAAVPPSERPPAGADDPQSLARMATRAEVRQPGTLERVLGGAGGAMGGGAMGGGSGPGLGTIIGGSLLTSLAGGFIGSAIADHFFNNTSAGRGFFGGGGGGFGGGGFGGGPQVINETTNIYEGGSQDGADDAVNDTSDDTSYDTSADDAADDSTDDSTDDSGDDSGTDDSGGYDDGGGSDDV